MKTVGDLLKQARLRHGLSIADLEGQTHIKSGFIKAIEEGRWEKLPEENVVVGFVKSLAHFLDVEEIKAVALFRREYTPKLLNAIPRHGGVQNDKGQIERRFVWGPRMTFLAGVMVIVFIVLGYLGVQYRNFNSLPALSVSQPTAGQSVALGDFTVRGKADPDATVIVNDQAVIVNSDGSFSANVLISDNTSEVKVTAKSRSGKTVSISRRIIVTQ
jgi:cytoskeletal protein RodZ